MLGLLRETDYLVVVEEDTSLPSFSSSVTTITLEVVFFELPPELPPELLKLWSERITVQALIICLMLKFKDLVIGLR